MQEKKVLFICTGNYFRSRFAEAVFNYTVHKDSINGWKAFSRGLNIAALNEEQRKLSMSIYTAAALKRLGIAETFSGEVPVSLSQHDLDQSEVIIAVNRGEHQVLLEKGFSGPALSKIRYWEVADIHEIDPVVALAAIEPKVQALIEELYL